MLVKCAMYANEQVTLDNIVERSIGDMASYILRRTLYAIPLLFLITIISFGMMQMAPGDPTALMLDPMIKKENLEAYKEAYGLNDNVVVQYVRWLGNMVQGNFGESLIRQGVQPGYPIHCC